MKKQILAQMLTCSLIAGSSCVAFAAAPSHANQGDMPVYNLDPTVVTATRTPVKAFNANADVNVITAKDIELNHFQNITEALQTVPGVIVQNYQGAGYDLSNKLMINGSKNVVVLVDGVKLNPSGFNSMLSSAPLIELKDMNNIAKIEVLKGSASTLYGADAAGGVISITTKTPMSNKTVVSAETGSFGNRVYGVQNTGIEGKTSWKINLQKNKTGDFKDAHGFKHINDSDANTVDIMVKQKLDDKNTLKLNYSNYSADNEWAALWEPRLKGQASNTKYGFTLDSKLSDKADNKLIYSKQNYKYNYQGYSTWTVPKITYTAPAFSRYNSTYIADQYNNQIDDKNLLTAGFELQKTSAPGYKNDINNKSVYVQDQIKVDDKWDVTPGLRYFHSNISGNRLNPAINVGYKFDKDTNMYVSYASYYIIPSLDQLYGQWGPNPNLKPENGYTKEIGLNHRVSKKMVLSSHYYQRNAKNMIIWSNNKYENLATAKTYGFDFQIKNQFDKNWSSFLGYTHLNITSPNKVDNVGHIIPDKTVNVGVNYHKDAFDASLLGNGVYGLTGTKANQFPATNYWTWDLSLNYKANEQAQVYFKVNNLFDKYYAPISNVAWGMPGQWWAAPGRSFVLGMNYRF